MRNISGLLRGQVKVKEDKELGQLRFCLDVPVLKQGCSDDTCQRHFRSLPPEWCYLSGTSGAYIVHCKSLHSAGGEFSPFFVTTMVAGTHIVTSLPTFSGRVPNQKFPGFFNRVSPLSPLHQRGTKDYSSTEESSHVFLIIPVFLEHKSSLRYFLP